MPEQILEFSSNHLLLVASFIALLAVILFIEYRNLTQNFTSIGPSAAITVINNENPVLLDVREMNELGDGMLRDSVHIPLSAVNKRLSEMDKYRDRPVLVYCRSGNRSGSVCRSLNGRGFDKVFNLSGGIMAWRDAHLPISKKTDSKKNKKNKKLN